MRPYIILRQTGIIANSSPARRGLLSASGQARYRQQGGQGSLAATSAMAFSTDRANTIGFIGLGAMGHHMVKLLTTPDRVEL
jgi:hypothetical protein